MYRNILAPTDGSELSHKAVLEAARIAKSMGAKLLLLHVRSPIDIPHHVEGGVLSRYGEGKLMEEIAVEERRLLDAALAVAASAGVEAEGSFISGYSPYESIIRVAKDQNSDLIVMASRIRHGIPRFVIQSETHKVLMNTEIPVLVVR
ncbi:MAG: universal stress protein [Betaproteobacteria bacterium]|nr:universal stress protein [Betaproteobacteria bacterium]